MTDSTTDAETAVDDAYLKKLNKTLRKYFDVRRVRAENSLKETKQRDKLTKKFADIDEPLAKEEAELKAVLRAMIIPNRAKLLVGRLKSTKTTYGVVSFGDKKKTISVTNPKGLEMRARKDRYLTRLFKTVTIRKPIAAAVTEFMETMPESVTKKYEPFVKRDGGYEEVSVQPNDPYIKKFDPNKLSVSKVNLGKAELGEDEQSPDA